VLQLISTTIANPDLTRPEIALKVDRHTIAKRLWRGVAEDGSEFGFELAAPLKSGDTIWQTDAVRYVVRQSPEAVLAVALEMAPSAAAGIGWAIGNLHLELSAEATRLLAPDEPAVRQLLTRLAVPFTETTAVFRPGRFNRSGAVAPAELGASHKH
jgi:urease accessory protein